MKQQEKTLLDLKASEEGLRGFDFICRTYDAKLVELMKPNLSFFVRSCKKNVKENL